MGTAGRTRRQRRNEAAHARGPQRHERHLEARAQAPALQRTAQRVRLAGGGGAVLHIGVLERLQFGLQRSPGIERPLQAGAQRLDLPLGQSEAALGRVAAAGVQPPPAVPRNGAPDAAPWRRARRDEAGRGGKLGVSTRHSRTQLGAAQAGHVKYTFEYFGCGGRAAAGTRTTRRHHMFE